MVGRKLSTVALAGTLTVIGIVGGCRDSASTGPSGVPSSTFAANVRLQQGDIQTGSVALPLPQSLRVKVTDAGGAPVQGAGVNWSVLAGGGSVNPPTGISDVNGFVSTSWTLGTTLGANTVRAYLTNGFVIDSVSFHATAVAGAPVTITIIAGSTPPTSSRVASTLSPISFTVTDQFHHPTPGITVTFTTAPGSGTTNPTSAITDESGVVSTLWTLGNLVGTHSLMATIAGQLPLAVTEATTPDTSRRLAIVAGSGQSIAVGGLAPVALSVKVTDRFTNPIAGDAISWTDSIGNGNIVNPTSGVTDAAGVATATLRLGVMAGPQAVRVRTPGSGGQVVRFTANAQIQFRDVYAGDYYVCGVASGDRGYCWGFGEDGQLGTLEMKSKPSPTWPVVTTDTILGPWPTFRDISGGKSHVCGVGIQRTIFCWGFNPDGREFMVPPAGRLARALDVAVPAFGVLNPLLASTRTVGAGESFSCALSLGGIAFCAGNNEVGQVGAGIASASFFGTTLVDTSVIGEPTRYASIAVGERHACGIPRLNSLLAGSPVVAATQVPYCWGAGGDGQLGAGNTGATPHDSTLATKILPIAGVTAFDSTSLVAGAAHTCALVSQPPASAGQAYCWGNNSYGQLGINLPTDNVPHATPTLVGGGVVFARLYAGQYHTCGLTASGVAMCWGRNSSGQLGNGGTANAVAPVPVAGALLFHGLAMGELFTCGITGNGPSLPGTTGAIGTIFCWGDNEFGQLGLGAFGANGAPSLTPQKVIFQP